MKNSLKVIAASFMVICAIYTSGKAQTINPARLGIKGGVNFSNLYAKDADNTKMLTGFNLGLFAKLPITNFIAFQPEFYYTTKGARVTYNNILVSGTANFHLNYLELPLLLVVNINENFNVHAGPYASYLLSGKVKNESSATIFDFEQNINTDDYNKLDAGIAAGAGIDLRALSLGLRYNYGLTKVGKEKTFLGTSYTFPDAKNGVINFYISLALN